MTDPTAAMPIPEPEDRGPGGGNGGGTGGGNGGGPGGTVLGGRYRLESVAGRGGMAEVWRARDTVLDRVVAVKWFTPGAGDVAAPARQQAEMKLLAGFNHPGLVTVYDAGVQETPMGDRPYVVMEYVDGPTLAARLARGPMPVPAVIALGSSVAGALAYVHERGVVHRDIKPGNILLEGGDDAGPTTVKLADFGIARLVDDARVTKTGMTVGTASYLSPEQVRGEEITPKSDVYSLALVLLEAFTGTVEFPGSPVEAAVARLNRDPVIPGTLGPVLGPLLAAMTARDPGLRPTAREVVDRLAGTTGAVSGPASSTTTYIPAGGTAATAYIPPTGGVPRPIVASLPPEPMPPVRPLADDDPLDRPERAPRPIWPWIVAIALLIIIGAVVAFAVTSGGGDDPAGTTTTTPAATTSAPTTPSATTTAPSTPSDTPTQETSEAPTTEPPTTATATETVTETPTSTPPTTSTPPSTPPTTPTTPTSSPPTSPAGIGDGPGAGGGPAGGGGPGAGGGPGGARGTATN
ncbi:serine/threonine-protein kinase [Jatrophihabitans sp. YIM 134969]